MGGYTVVVERLSIMGQESQGLIPGSERKVAFVLFCRGLALYSMFRTASSLVFLKPVTHLWSLLAVHLILTVLILDALEASCCSMSHY